MECSSCILSPVVQALAALTKTYTTVNTSKPASRNTPPSGPKPSELNPLETKILREKAKKKSKKAIYEPLQSVSKDFERIVALAHKLIDSPDGIHPSPIQSACLACARSSNDDNLSHSGQTFVSIDAMATSGLAASPSRAQSLSSGSDSDCGRASLDGNESRDDDDLTSGGMSARSFQDDDRDPFFDDDGSDSDRPLQTAHDYLSAHSHPLSSNSHSESCSLLPSNIEDLLRKQLSSFNALDDFEKFLVLCVWSGMSFSDIGTMKWIPREMRHPQSKQLISQRWSKLVESFPLASVLQKSTPCRSVNSALSKHYSDECACQGVFDFHDGVLDAKTRTQYEDDAPAKQINLFG